MLKFLFLFLVMNVANADVMPIKNVNPQTYYISRQELTWMYTLKTRFWQDGTRITVYYIDPTSALHRQFCSDVLGISVTQFNQMVSSRINTGTASHYKLTRNITDMHFRVSAQPGAIGYVDKDSVIINRDGYVHEIEIIN